MKKTKSNSEGTLQSAVKHFKKDMTNEFGLQEFVSASCFKRQLHPCVTQHGSLGRVPLSSWPGQMLRVTSKVVEGAVGGKKKKCFRN